MEQEQQLILKLYGKIYDLTAYVDDHPGGEDILWDLNKTDATCDFDDIGHSEEAVNNLKQFEIQLPPQTLNWETVNPQLQSYQHDPSFKNSFFSKCCAWFCFGLHRRYKIHQL